MCLVVRRHGRPERVRQVEVKAIRKLQHPVRSRKLVGFVDGDEELE